MKDEESEKEEVVPQTNESAALSVAKKKQIFKKEKLKNIKAKIQELKQRSLKLKKKNLE